MSISNKHLQSGIVVDRMIQTNTTLQRTIRTRSL